MRAPSVLFVTYYSRRRGARTCELVVENGVVIGREGSTTWSIPLNQLHLRRHLGQWGASKHGQAKVHFINHPTDEPALRRLVELAEDVRRKRLAAVNEFRDELHVLAGSAPSLADPAPVWVTCGNCGAPDQERGQACHYCGLHVGS